MREIIARLNDLSIEVSDRPCPDYLSLLGSVEFGSESLGYRRLGVEDHVRRLGDSFYFLIRRDHAAVGVFALTPGELVFGEESIQGVYRSQLCVADTERRRGLARLLRQSAIDWIRDRLSGKPLMTWGCVDENNTRVLSLLTSQGALKLGTLCSYLCYRQWPRPSTNVTRTERPSTPQSTPQLAMRRPASPTVLIADDSVTAAMDTVTLELLHYGRSAERAYRYLLRFIPPARQRFHPAAFRYAKLSDLEFHRSDPSSLDALIQHSMAMSKTHYAAIIRDPRAVDADMRRAFGRFVVTTRIAVIAENFGVSPELISRIQGCPLHLAPVDI